MYLYNALIIMVPHSTSFDQTTHFLANEVCRLGHAHRIHWSYHISYHREAVGLTEEWNDILKTQRWPLTCLAIF